MRLVRALPRSGSRSRSWSGSRSWSRSDAKVVQVHAKKRITAREPRVVLEVKPVEADPETTKRIMKSKAAGGTGR